MAIPLQEGTNILVERRRFGKSYAMPSMQMATDHYSIGYTISGDRRTIMPSGTFSYHSGDVSMLRPFIYHRTIAESEEVYERILIKFSPEYIKPFTETLGQQIFESLYDRKVCHFTKEVSGKIMEMFLEMAKEYEKEKPYREFVLQGMLFRLLLTVYEEALPDEEETLHRTPLTPPVMEAIMYMEDNYASNPSLGEAAQVANFSPSYFSRLFLSQLGMPYSEYLNNVKIRHAQILLAQTEHSLMEIAQETGFCHGNYFSAQFKKKVGMTPGRYRRQARCQLGADAPSVI